MAGQSVLCNDNVLRNYDEEDMRYLQTCFYSMLSEKENYDHNIKDSFDLLKDESLCNSVGPTDSYDFNSNSSDWCKDGSKNDDDADSGYKSISSPASLRCQINVMPLFSDILSKGLDEEDISFLEKSFNGVVWDDNEKYWTSKTFWDWHPPTAIEEKPVSSNDSVNSTGCARCEGYFKVNKSARYTVKSVDKDLEGCRTLYSKRYKGNKQSMSRDARNDQRRLFTAYQTITDSALLKLNELKFRKKKLRLGKSDIHGLGLFACEPISPNEIIIEYVGQIIRPIIADLREKQYKSSGLGSYCFKVDDDTIIDATKYGNLNRYINHSCNPNSYAKILNIGNNKKIVIYSKKHIKINEEITYDYKMPFEDEKIKCLCMAPGCRKSLN